MKQKYSWLGQIVFWLVLLLKDIEFYRTYHEDYSISRVILLPIGYLVMFMTAFYGGYWLIVTYVVQSAPYRISIGIWRVVATFSLIVFVRFVIEFGFFKPVLNYDNYLHNQHFTWLWFTQNALLFYWSWVLYGMLCGFTLHYVQRQQREREQMKAEVSLLRAQVNPHFLFNVLNDVYSLSLIRPEQTPNALLKLSSLLRYMLYTSQIASVPLSDEIDYIISYIDLEQIGQKGQVNVQTSFTGSVQERHIAPMILIPFVENAFKHGVLFQPDQSILISLRAESNELSFRCRNSKRVGAKDKTGGIGLVNLRRRLDLEYPKRYTLHIDDTDTLFDVNLRLTF